MVTRNGCLLALTVIGLLFAGSNAIGAAVCAEPVGVWSDGPVKAMATREDLGFVGAGPKLMIIDVADPAIPAVLAELTLPGTILDLAIDDDLAFAAIGGHGVAIVDVLDPWTPELIAVVAVNGFAEAVAASAERLAVVVSSGVNQKVMSLECFDLSEPDQPQAIGSLKYSGDDSFYIRHENLAMDDRFAYWASGSTTLVIDVDGPSGPRLVNQHSQLEYTHCWVAGIGISNGRLVVARSWISGDLRSQKATLTVYETDGSGNLETTGSWTDEDDLWWAAAVNLGRVAVYRYTDEIAILLFSLTNPSNPRPVAWMEMHYSESLDELALGDGCLLASDEDLRIAGFQGSTGLSWVSGIDTADRAVAVAAGGDRAYVATTGTTAPPTSHLHVLDLSRPQQPSEIARTEFSTSRLTDLAVIDDRLVTISESDEVLTYDVSNPETPVLESRIEIPGDDSYGQDSLAVGTDVVYVMWNGYSSGFNYNVVSVLDFSTPSDPLVVNEVAIESGLRGLSISGDQLMVATPTGMWLFDVSAETMPVLVSVVDDVATWLRTGAITTGAAYLGDDDGLYTIDISNPQRPVKSGFLRIEPGVRRLVLTPGILWVGTRYVSPENSGDLLVYDISDPLDPVLIEGPIGPRGMSEVLPLGGYALVASEFEGLETLWTRCRYSEAPPLARSASVD